MLQNGGTLGNAIKCNRLNLSLSTHSRVQNSLPSLPLWLVANLGGLQQIKQIVYRAKNLKNALLGNGTHQLMMERIADEAKDTAKQQMRGLLFALVRAYYKQRSRTA